LPFPNKFLQKFIREKGFPPIYTRARPEYNIATMSANNPLSPGSPAPAPDRDGSRIMELGRGRRIFKWYDYLAPTPEQLDALQQQYDLHPLAMEDVRTFDERAKVLDFGSYLFITVHSLTRSGGEMVDHELEVFLGRDYLITVYVEPLPEIDIALKRFLGDAKRQDLGPDFFLYLIVDELTNNLFPMLDQMDDEIDDIEQETLEHATPKTLKQIFELKQEYIRMRRSVAPMRDVMNALAGTRYGLIDSKTALYYRDVYDRLSRIYELIETGRDLLGNVLDTYLSVQSNRLNEVTKTLTIIATIFLPISFIVGWGGMNFTHMPFTSDAWFWAVNASLVIVPIIMLIYFRRKGWF
jgi:magnesium transporter